MKIFMPFQISLTLNLRFVKKKKKHFGNFVNQIDSIKAQLQSIWEKIEQNLTEDLIEKENFLQNKLGRFIQNELKLFIRNLNLE